MTHLIALALCWPLLTAVASPQDSGPPSNLRRAVAELQLDLVTRVGTAADLARVEELLGEALDLAQVSFAAGGSASPELREALAALLAARADLWLALDGAAPPAADLVAIPPGRPAPASGSALATLLQELAARPDLSGRAAALRQGPADNSSAWLDELLEPWAAQWVRTQFGAVDRDIYQKVTARRDPSHAGACEPWEVAPVCVRLLRWDWNRVLLEPGAGAAVASLESIAGGAPATLTALDRVLAERFGGAVDEWSLRAVSNLAGRTGLRDLVTREGLSPLLIRLLQAGRHVASPHLHGILRRLQECREELPPELVRAWGDAVLAAEPESARLLLLPFGDLRPLARQPSDARMPDPTLEWHRSLLRRVLATEDLELALGAGALLLSVEDLGLLDWLRHPQVERRRLVLYVVTNVCSSSALTLKTADPRILEAWPILLSDQDPGLRDAAASNLGRSSLLTREWLLQAFSVASDEVRAELASRCAHLLTLSQGNDDPLRNKQQRALETVVREDGEVRAAVVAAADETALTDWLQGPWDTAELVRSEVLPLARSGAPRIVAAIDQLLLRGTWPAEAWLEVLGARLRGPLPPGDNWDWRNAAAAIARLEVEPRAMALAHEVGSGALRSRLFWNTQDQRMSGMLAPLPSAAQRWVAATSWNGGSNGQAWLERLRLFAGPGFLVSLVEDRSLPLEMRMWAATDLDPALEDHDARLLELVAEIAGSAEALFAVQVRNYRFRDANGALARALPELPFDPLRSWSVAARQLFYQQLDAEAPGAEAALRAVLEDFVRHSEGAGEQRLYLSNDPVKRAVSAVAPTASAETRAAILAAFRRWPDPILLQYLAQFGGPEFIDELAACLHEPRLDSLGQMAVDHLRRYPENDVAAQALRGALLSPNRSVAEAAAVALDSWERYREAADSALGVPSEAAAIAELFALLDHGEPGLRAEAAQGLASLGAAVAIPRLIGLLRDADPGVRAAARAALDRLYARPLGPPPVGGPEPRERAEPPQDS
jgi:HEAT repeat protein